jgi:hypothetical protein
MYRDHEVERRCAERLAELARERELVRREELLRTNRHDGGALRTSVAALLARLAARLEPTSLRRLASDLPAAKHPA